MFVENIMKPVPFSIITVMVLIVGLSGCTQQHSDAPESAPPDLIIHGGHVITVDNKQLEVTAFAVRDGLFVAAGSDEAILALAAPGTLLRDIKGKTVVPGFNDAHLHSVMFPPQATPLWEAKSIDQVVELLKSDVSKRVGPWIVGIGYDDTLLGRHLTREDLDRVSSEHPVMAIHGSLHIIAVNSRALETAKLPVPLVDPEGGTFFEMKLAHPTVS